jgi:hypothetical protein
LTDARANAIQRLIGMLISPSATLRTAIQDPRPADLAALIVMISAICSAGFLFTRVGYLAGLDQTVRQLESFGTVITDASYAELRSWQAYRPWLSAATIVVGWPLIWMLAAGAFRFLGNRAGSVRASFAHVYSIVVHASAVLALRSLVSVPINFARESAGGATSLALLLPAFGESTVPARIVGAIDLFVLWWIVLVSLGLGMLYHVRAWAVGRWLFSAYAAGALVLALLQAFRGGV